MNTVMDEALVVHEVLRTLGFSADDIYVGFAKNGIFVVLKTQDKTFTISCGPRPNGVNEEELVNIWQTSVAKWNGTHEHSLKDSDKRALMDESKLFYPDRATALGTLILKLKQVGIELPKKN